MTWRSPQDVVAGLPANVVKELHRLNCVIRAPAAGYGDEPPANVFEAEIGRKGQHDWVALCSTNRVSRIVILWGGSAQCPAIDEPMPDDAGCPPGYAVMDEYIEAGSAAEARSAAEAIGLEEKDIPDVFRDRADHQTIRVLGDHNGSDEHYCVDGRWFLLGDGD